MRANNKTRHGPFFGLGSMLLATAAVAFFASGCGIPRSATSGIGSASYAVSSFNAGLGIPVAPVIPPPGFIFTQYQAPLDYRFANRGEGTSASANRLGTSEASYLRIPFISPNLSFAWDDASLRAAQQSGGLQRMDYVDYEVLSVLGIYTNVKFHIYGE